VWRLGGGLELEKAALFAGGNSQGPGAELPRNGPHRQYVVGSAPFHSIGPSRSTLKGACRPFPDLWLGPHGIRTFRNVPFQIGAYATWDYRVIIFGITTSALTSYEA
jgi:hypothetical protein